MPHQSEITYSSTWRGIYSYMFSNGPTSSIHMPLYSGSDVLNTITRFLDNTKVPLCGSELFLIVKRYPNETDITQLTTRLRNYHATLNIMASDTPSGGLYPQTLYDLATKTNGVCGFDKDNKMLYSVEFFPTCFNPFLIYAANPQISGAGSLTLPSITVPSESFVGYWFTMTVQDSGPINVVQTSILSWSNPNLFYKGNQLGVNDTYTGDAVLYGNHLSLWEDISKGVYSTKLDFHYTDSETRRLQIRIHGSTNTDCTPTTPTTFFLAYSNDLDEDDFSEIMHIFDKKAKNIAPQYQHFAALKFDLPHQADMMFSSTWSGIYDDIILDGPTSSIYMPLYSGSDVLNAITRFLDNTKVPLCGSELFLLVKRYPNATDITQLTTRLRNYHATVNIMASDTPEISWAPSPQTLYDLASKTNGFCGFDRDDKMVSSLEYFPTFVNPFLIYAANPQISGGGSITLPPLTVPSESSVPIGYRFTMTVQDDGPIDVVKTAILSWLNPSLFYKGSELGINDTDTGDAVLYGNHLGLSENASKGVYSMNLKYHYTDSKTRRLQIRVHGSSNNPVDNWIPYDN